MTATDELRKLLDERGVEYYKHEDGEPLRELHEGRDDATSWRVGGANVCAVPFDDYTFDLWIDHATPEQAIAATLGSGTCEYAIKDNMNETEGMGDVWIECSACHCAFDYYADEWLMNMHYCPNCGARVERREE